LPRHEKKEIAPCFDPQAGREQAGRRPALVLSPFLYNSRSGLALVCPITSKVKGHSFEVALPAGLAVAGVVLADHVKSLDWKARRATRAGRVPEEVLGDVLAKLTALLGG
jgi:mRNA interferase MazF